MNTGTPSQQADEAAVNAVLAELYKAWDAGDADAFAAGYTEDATAILPGSCRRGREEIRQNMADGFAGPLKGSTTVNRNGAVRFLGSDVAVVLSESGILFAGESEVPAGRLVNATWVLHRAGDRWRIAAYHNSPATLG